MAAAQGSYWVTAELRGLGIELKTQVCLQQKTGRMIMQYSRIKKVGSGSFGDVYRGINNENNEAVAIKV